MVLFSSCAKDLTITSVNDIESPVNLQSQLKSNREYKKLVYYWSNEGRTAHDDSLRRDNPGCRNVDLLISNVIFKHQKITQFIAQNPEYQYNEDIIIESLRDAKKNRVVTTKLDAIDAGTAQIYDVDRIYNSINDIVFHYQRAMEYCPIGYLGIYFDEISDRLNLMIGTTAFCDFTYNYMSYITRSDITFILETGMYNGSNATWQNIVNECRFMTNPSSIKNYHIKIGCTQCDGSSGGGGSVPGGGIVNPDPKPEESCSDAKCPDCKKCLNPTKDTCKKCTGHCDHEICSGCNKFIRPEGTTRVAAECAGHDYCDSSGPVCECGERHTDVSTGLPKCAEVSYWLVYNSLTEGINCVKYYAEVVKVELAGLYVSFGKMYIHYDSGNTSGAARCAIGTCKKSRESGTTYFNVTKNGICSKEYIRLFIHGHPDIENKIQTIEGTEGMYRTDLKISDEDHAKVAMYGCPGLIVTEFGVFRYTSSKLESIFCPLFYY